MAEHDFSGYATKVGLKCSDGLTIKHGAFRGDDGRKVPLVWQHQHGDPMNVLGHVLLEDRADGTYAYAFLNDSEPGQQAKALVKHGDVEALSIYARQVVKKASDVVHGVIHEVSLVLAGANPGALIDFVGFAHSDDWDGSDNEAIIMMNIPLEHSAPLNSPDDADETDESAIEHADGETVGDIFETLSDKQKDAVYEMLARILETGENVEQSAIDENQADAADDEPDTIQHSDSPEGTQMTRNVFDTEVDASKGATLSHSQIQTLVADARRLGSLKESVLAHADDYGITNIEVLFPDAVAIENRPEWITRRMDWVEGVLNGTRKIPWSKIKSMSADLTHEDARAKGYIKGTMKKEQFFSIAKRETGPKTIYKKQKLDRDDIIDATEFDVVQWLWVEMNFMLREEVARAILIGDGREVDDPDKIDEDKIRPIAHDHEFYTDVVIVPANVNGSAMVEAVVRNRETYKGDGEPSAYMTRSVLNDMLLLKDAMGRRLYRTRAELAAELEVREIVLVPVMEGHLTDDGELLMILVNLADYAVGSTQGGQITRFNQFDIDFNQEKYLIEGRMSGALTKHKRAQVIVRTAGTSVTPTVPTFVAATGVVTIPTVTGVVYKNQTTGATLTAGAQSAIAAGATISVVAVPATDYYFPHNTDADWDFTRTA